MNEIDISELVTEARRREYPHAIRAALEAIHILDNRGEVESELYNELTLLWMGLIRGELRRFIEASIVDDRRCWGQIADFRSEWSDELDFEEDLKVIALLMGVEYNRLVFRAFPPEQAAELFRRDLDIEGFRRLAQVIMHAGTREDIEYLLALARVDFILEEEAPGVVSALHHCLRERR